MCVRGVGGNSIRDVNRTRANICAELYAITAGNTDWFKYSISRIIRTVCAH